MEQTGARHGTIVVLRPDGGVVQLATRGRDTGCCTLSPGGGGRVLPALLDAARPVRVADFEPDAGITSLPRHARPFPFLGVPIVMRGRVLGALLLMADTGVEPFRADDQKLATSLAGRVGTAMDHASLLARSRLGPGGLDGLREVSDALLEGRDIDDALRLMIRHAMGPVGAAMGVVAATGPEPGSMVVRLAEGDRGPAVLGRSFPAEGPYHPLLAAAGAASALALPLDTGRDGPGCLVLTGPVGGGSFDDGDLETVRAFVAEAAAVVRSAELGGDLPRLSTMDDNERLAMELHDGVVQTLFAVSLSVEALADGEAVATGQGSLRAPLLEAVVTIRGAIAELRMYIEGLHPPERPGGGPKRTLASDLVELVQSFRGSTSASITADVDPRAASLLQERVGEIVQAAREALSNAVRHAGAGTIALRFSARPDDVMLEVADDGIGFDPDIVRRGHGLSNLRTRAHLLGGTFRLDSAPGRGTTVRIVIPA